MTSLASLPDVGTGGDHAAVALWPDLTGQKYSRRQAESLKLRKTKSLAGYYSSHQHRRQLSPTLSKYLQSRARVSEEER